MSAAAEGPIYLKISMLVWSNENAMRNLSKDATHDAESHIVYSTVFISESRKANRHIEYNMTLPKLTCHRDWTFSGNMGASGHWWRWSWVWHWDRSSGRCAIGCVTACGSHDERVSPQGFGEGCDEQGYQDHSPSSTSIWTQKKNYEVLNQIHDIRDIKFEQWKRKQYILLPQSYETL